MKILVLDSGILINLSMNGLLYLIEGLKKISGVSFVITKDVKYETVDRPIGIPRFELGALSIKYLLESGIVQLSQDIGITEEKINPLTNKYMELANHAVQSRGQYIQVVSNAEMSCLALSKLLTDKKIENMIGLDERTTRILAEKPQNMEHLMSDKLHQSISIQKDKLKEFSQFRFIRSSELVYVAYKKGLLKITGPKVLEAALFATKFHGSSVSFEEINQLKKL